MYSFDVFDTIITRKTAQPKGVFYLIQRKLQNSVDSRLNSLGEDFAYHRLEAEIATRTYLQTKEEADITLEQIYDTLQTMLSLSEKERAELMQIEIQTEVDNALPITSTIQLIMKLLSHGEKVILISDMYLSSEAIRKLLAKAAPELPQLPLYVSNECNATKRNGNLFVKVKCLEGANYTSWTHYGDNYHSDVLMPTILGIEAHQIKQADLSVLEKELLLNYGDSALTQLSVGLARYCVVEKELTPYQRLGCDICAGILLPYIQWVINICVEQKITRLCFVSRDGYLLKKIADIIIEYNSLPLYTKYVYGSRKAWENDRNTNKRELLRRYLRQELGSVVEKTAFIDVQGTAKTMKDMLSVFAEDNVSPLHVFYFDMLKDNRWEKSKFYTFMSKEHCHYIEHFCRAPHGAVLTYELKEKKHIVPVFDFYKEGTWEEHGLREFEEGIIHMTDTMVQSVIPNMYIEDGLIIAKETIRLVDEERDEVCLEFVRQVPHSDNNEDMPFRYQYCLKRNNYQKLIIYGTGVRGKRLGKLLQIDNHYEVVAWTVSDPNIKFEYGSVIPIREAIKLEYDKIVLAILDEKAKEGLRQVLVELGVEANDIVDYEDIVEQFEVRDM